MVKRAGRGQIKIREVKFVQKWQILSTLERRSPPPFFSFFFIREAFRKNAAVLLDFVQMRGGEGPAQIFGHFFISAFWSIKGVYLYFFQNDNNFNFKLFLGCIHGPQSKYSDFI